MAATTLAALVAQAQVDIPTIQANIATRQANLAVAQQAEADINAALTILNNQLRQRLLIISVAQIVIGNQTLDPVAS